MQHIWLFLGTTFFPFFNEFYLLSRNKTKKNLPIFRTIINYQTLLFCTILYQLIQGQFAIPIIPWTKGSRREHQFKMSQLVNYAGMKYLILVQKAPFCCLLHLLTIPTDCLLYLQNRDNIVIMWWNNISVVYLQ